MHEVALAENAKRDAAQAELEAAYAEHEERERNRAAQLTLFETEFPGISGAEREQERL